METQRIGRRARRARPAWSNLATIGKRVRRRWQRRSRGAGTEPLVGDVGWAHRVEACEARIEHVERMLEGLQDALYRHEILDEENIAELRRRTAPEQMARDLSQDARRRRL
jgi:hypothetical protein